MGKQQNENLIVERIKIAVQVYKATFVGKTFMYVFDDRYIEVVFRARDFMHLTGVDSTLSASSFYRDAVRGNISTQQFGFTHRNPYDLSKKKTAKLITLSSVTNSDLIILEDLYTNTATYKFGVTDLGFTVCLDKDVASNHYYPRSLRVEDSFDRASDAFEVDYIFSKPNDEKLYSDLLYMNNGRSLDNLPEEIASLINITRL